jgi:hypothetical protein
MLVIRPIEISFTLHTTKNEHKYTVIKSNKRKEFVSYYSPDVRVREQLDEDVQDPVLQVELAAGRSNPS